MADRHATPRPAKEHVASLTYKPGWTFKVGGPDGRYMCVFARTPNSLDPGCERTTQHMFELPEGPITPAAFSRWAFWNLLRVEFHETSEFLQLDGFRPFWPHHQDEGDPYALVDRWETP